jgi:hypothetical protein
MRVWACLSALALLACRPSQAPTVTHSANGVTELRWQELPHDSVPGAPPSLKTDGAAAVRLRGVTVRAMVVPPLAFTELELSFDDFSGSGARLDVELPPGAALSRFAVQDRDAWQNAKLADNAQAKRAIGRTLTSTDPALAQPRAARRFSARLLKGSGPPRVLLGYAEILLSSQASYRVKLAGLPKLDRLQVSVELKTAAPRRFELSRQGFVPDRDFVLGSAELGAKAATTELRAGPYFVLRQPADATPSAELSFLVDTSQSQTIPLDQLSDRLVALSERLAKLSPSLLLSVVAFDQEVLPIVIKARAPLTREQLAPLRERRPLGGTDLMYALSETIAEGLPHRHIVMLSDFEGTIRSVGHGFNIKRSEMTRLDTIVKDADGERKHLERMQQTGGGYGYPGVLLRWDDDLERLAKRLFQPTPNKMSLGLKGASWSTSSLTQEAPPIGEDLLILAEAGQEGGFELKLGSRDHALPPASTDPILVELLRHVVGQARLDQGVGAFGSGYDDDQAAALEAFNRAALEYGVLSPHNSFVVSGANGATLAGRAFETVEAPGLMRYTMAEPKATPPEQDKCPDLIGLVNAQLKTAKKGCPPLLVSLSAESPRVVAQVAFAGGSAQPNVAASPHLSQLADLLGLRSELVKVDVRASSKARAQGVVKYLVGRGIAAARLQADVLVPGTLDPRAPSPDCKSKGEDVLLEVREMKLPSVLVDTPSKIEKKSGTAAVTGAPPSRSASIQALIRAARESDEKPRSLDEAVRASERWVTEQPHNPPAYAALGLTLLATRDDPGAARAFGTLFELDAAGAGLDVAAGLRFLQIAPLRAQALRHEGNETTLDARLGALAMKAFRQQWQDHPEQFEGARAYAYTALRAEHYREAFGMIWEASKYSSFIKQVELPLFAQLYLAHERDAANSVEGFFPSQCLFPLQADVLGAVLSWEDVESELEVTVKSVGGGYGYDSVLSERSAGGALKWVPLPSADAAYPIQVTVRAKNLSKNGYAFGVLRVLNTRGKRRIFTEEKPFVLTAPGEGLVVLEQTILQRPQ